MGLSLIGPDEGPTPRPTALILKCDGDHGMFSVVSEFHQYGYIAQRRSATAAGWRVTGDGKVYGPCCNG